MTVRAIGPLIRRIRRRPLDCTLRRELGSPWLLNARTGHLPVLAATVTDAEPCRFTAHMFRRRDYHRRIALIALCADKKIAPILPKLIARSACYMCSELTWQQRH